MIQLENLNVVRNDNTLIAGLHLQMHVGEFWAILGNNGAGKSTLLQMMAGLFGFRSGEILLDGSSVSQLAAIHRAQKVAYLNQQQEPHLDGSIEQMVRFGRYPWHQLTQFTDEDEELIQSALTFTGLMDKKSHLLNELSGGEQRKAELATVLAQDSKVFLFDEPMNHMDLNFKIKFMKRMKQMQSKKLIVMITHDLNFVQKYCSHTLLIGSGGSWASGETSQVLTSENIQKHLQIDWQDISI